MMGDFYMGPETGRKKWHNNMITTRTSTKVSARENALNFLLLREPIHLPVQGQ